MNPTPFSNMADDFGLAFSAGTQAAMASVLAAVLAPLLACVTLWIIIQGILVMRGDMDARQGVTRILKISLVVGILTSATLYTTYVQNLFVTTIPNWAASAASGGGAGTINTPQTFDNMWQVTEHTIETVGSQISMYDVTDAVSLVLIEIAIMIILVVTFAIYEFAIIVVGIIVAIGPILLVGYLFESTKFVADRWIGKLITYSILTLLINITLSIVLTGEKNYMRVILMTEGQGMESVPMEIKILIELAMFFAMGAFIIVSLPAIAAVLGGGLGVSPGAAILNAFATLASGGSAPAPKAAPKPKAA